MVAASEQPRTHSSAAKQLGKAASVHIVDMRDTSVVTAVACRGAAILNLGVYFVFLSGLCIYAACLGGLGMAGPLLGTMRASVLSYVGGKASKREPAGVQTSAAAADKHALVDYPPAMLVVYDTALLYNNVVAWGVGRQTLQDHFDTALSQNHLDIGVGSGYLPAHSKRLQTLAKNPLSSQSASLALWDLNAAPLTYAAGRIDKACSRGSAQSHLTISTRSVDVLDTTSVQNAMKDRETRFDSVTMFYLFHCVPNPATGGSAPGSKDADREGSITKFARGFANMRSIATKGAIITGATSQYIGKGESFVLPLMDSCANVHTQSPSSLFASLSTVVTASDPALASSCSNLQFAVGSAMMDLYQNRFKHFYNHHDTLDTVRAGAQQAGLAVRSIYARGFVVFFVLANE